jgi:hypothetical protein
MNWSGVGQVDPHMINAVESADSRTAGDTVDTAAEATAAVNTAAATGNDPLIRVVLIQ